MRQADLVLGPPMPYLEAVETVQKRLPCAPAMFYGWDSRERPYCGISAKSYQRLLSAVPEMSGEYKADRRDCENFAAWASCHIADQLAELQGDEDPLVFHGQVFGFIPCGDTVDRHSDLWFLDETGFFRMASAQRKVVLPAPDIARIKEIWRLEVR